MRQKSSDIEAFLRVCRDDQTRRKGKGKRRRGARCVPAGRGVCKTGKIRGL